MHIFDELMFDVPNQRNGSFDCVEFECRSDGLMFRFFKHYRIAADTDDMEMEDAGEMFIEADYTNPQDLGYRLSDALHGKHGYDTRALQAMINVLSNSRKIRYGEIAEEMVQACVRAKKGLF